MGNPQISESEFERLAGNLSVGLQQEWERLSTDERQIFLALLQDQQATKDLYALDYREIPVSPREFLTDPYFIGEDLVWNAENNTGLFPRWLEELCVVLDPRNEIFEWILSGSLGSGKTTAAMCAMMYQAYWLNCLKDPHAYLGRPKVTPIEMFFFSITLTTAEDAGIERFERMIGHGQYFQQHFPVGRRKRRGMGREDAAYKLEFPPFMSCIQGSQESHFISRDILAGVMDEANFVRQAKNTGAQNYDSTSKAYSLYMNVRRRIESRFLTMGKNYGLMCLISSAGSQYDFLEQHKKAMRTNPHVHISEFAVYDIQPWRFGTKRFYVLLGDEHKNSRILTDAEVASVAEPSEESLSEIFQRPICGVPIEFLDTFTRDVSAALREVCGIASEVSNPLIPIREQISATIDPLRLHPFTTDAPVIGHLSKTTLESFFRTELVAKWDGPRLKPLYFPEMERFIHIDLAKSQCAAGISMGGVCEVVEREIITPSGEKLFMLSPRLWYDFTLQLPPPPSPEEIHYAAIRAFVVFLRDVCGFKIKMVSFDGWQSVDSCQILLNQGFETDVLSMDKKPDPYLTLKSAFLDNRIIRYMYPTLERELAALQIFTEAGKTWIDHPVNGSKDIADSMCGVSWWAHESVRTASNLVSAKAQAARDTSRSS